MLFRVIVCWHCTELKPTIPVLSYLQSASISIVISFRASRRGLLRLREASDTRLLLRWMLPAPR